MSHISIETKIGENPYLVVVGNGAKDLLSSVIKKTMNPAPKRVAVVTSSDIKVGVDPGVEHKVFYLPDGEKSKNLQSVEKLCGEFSDYGLTRGDLVVAVGGGLISDIAGFAAAIYHRGMPVIFVATTLLAQVDAAIGGKTGVNLKQGKNLVGSFHQALAVLCDTQTLETLPKREQLSGMGEIAKYQFILESLADLPDYFSELGLDLNPKNLAEMPLADKVACCVGIKLFIVSQDEKDTGLRSLLNYGHTLGHALEIAGSFDLRHGEAVSIGLMYAAELACILGRIDEARAVKYREVLESHGLPTKLGNGQESISAEQLLDLMRRDKKARDEIVFVLEGPEGLETAVPVPDKAIKVALEKIK